MFGDSQLKFSVRSSASFINWLLLKKNRDHCSGRSDEARAPRKARRDLKLERDSRRIRESDVHAVLPTLDEGWRQLVVLRVVVEGVDKVRLLAAEPQHFTLGSVVEAQITESDRGATPNLKCDVKTFEARFVAVTETLAAIDKSITEKNTNEYLIRLSNASSSISRRRAAYSFENLLSLVCSGLRPT